MEYEARAKQDYDRLVEMGGRPTRPLRLPPTWTAIYEDGEIPLIDYDGKIEIIISGRIDPIGHHWKGESRPVRNELNNWHKFRKY